jgi:drug/metabolite transporter (DMT)-like permease
MNSPKAGAARAVAWAALIVVYVVWGTTYLAIRIVVREMPPFAAASLRFLIAGLVIGGLATVFEREPGWPTLRQWRDYGLAGLLFLAGGNAGVMWSETRVSSGVAALMVATTPLWLTLLDGLRAGGQRWTVRVWVGVVLGLVGVGLIARPHETAEPGHAAGMAALLVASLVWSVGALLVKSVGSKVGPLTASSIEMLAGSLGLGLESRLAGEPLAAFPAASTSAWLAFGYLVLFGAVLGFTAFAYAIHELPASTVGTYAYVNPVVAVFLGALLLHEPLSAGTLTGAVLIVVAVVTTTHRAAAA